MRRNPNPSPLPEWEPGLSQLRDLAPEALDERVQEWLGALHVKFVKRVASRNSRYRSYIGTIGDFPLDVAVECRMFQRQNRLQAYDVESFLGALVRQGLSAGLLVSTGDFSRPAYRLAASLATPRIRLIAGPEWMSDLSRRRIGVRRRSFKRWLLDRSRRRAVKKVGVSSPEAR